MIKVALMGTGNVARHLFDAFMEHGSIEVVQVLGRRNESLEYFIKRAKVAVADQFLEKADVYILAISDDSISQVARSLGNLDGILAHTSGSAPLEALPKTGRRGVFYPLQTFTKDFSVDFSKIPFCVEAENEKDTALLVQLASTLSDHVVEIDSDQRKGLHLAAMFTNNFVNHLYYIGQQICKEHHLPFEILLPLIQETTRKLEKLSPLDAQTGPARRRDTTTISRHLEMLKDSDYKEIYIQLTNSIQKTYGQKL